jgi:hypothetical protein
VSRKIFGPKRDKVAGDWRRWHSEELYDLHSSPNITRGIISRRMKSVVHVARRGQRRGAYRVLVGKPEGKTPIGRPKRRWEYNIKISLERIVW